MMRNPICGCMLCFWASCCIQVVFSLPVYCLAGIITREPIRKKLGIEGEVWEDACLHICGWQCALCQEQREIQDAIEDGRFNHDGRPIEGSAPITPLQTVTAMPPGYNMNLPMATATVAGMPIASATLGGAGMGANPMPTGVATANPGGFTLGEVTTTSGAITTSANPMALPTATATVGMPTATATFGAAPLVDDPDGESARQMPQSEIGERLL